MSEVSKESEFTPLLRRFEALLLVVDDLATAAARFDKSIADATGIVRRALSAARLTKHASETVADLEKPAAAGHLGKILTADDLEKSAAGDLSGSVGRLRDLLVECGDDMRLCQHWARPPFRDETFRLLN